MRSNQHPSMNGPTKEWEDQEEFRKVLFHDDKATLLEQLEAFELTWRIIKNGMLEEH
ncbi:hypothetical protein [Pontibacterium sp.]|uniref:hypothetical protein n=1 Tax=Pontibacterium sp. TaxID=2036026 RepID=UPI00356A99EF